MGRARRARKIAATAAYGGGGLAAGIGARRARLRRAQGRGQDRPPDRRPALRRRARRQRHLRRRAVGEPGRARRPRRLLRRRAWAPTTATRRSARSSPTASPPSPAGRSASPTSPSSAPSPRDLELQLANALDQVPRPHVAVIMVGANDVTHRIDKAVAVRHLETAVRALRALGTEVVVGTCPDLGTIEPIPQPLRLIGPPLVSRDLAAAQTVAVVEAGGRTVSLGDLLGPEFAERPHEMFSADRFHPSPAGLRPGGRRAAAQRLRRARRLVRRAADERAPDTPPRRGRGPGRRRGRACRARPRHRGQRHRDRRPEPRPARPLGVLLRRPHDPVPDRQRRRRRQPAGRRRGEAPTRRRRPDRGAERRGPARATPHPRTQPHGIPSRLTKRPLIRGRSTCCTRRTAVTEAVIVSTARTPIGRAFKGSLKDVRPDDLAVAGRSSAALAKVPELDPTTGRRPLPGLRRAVRASTAPTWPASSPCWPGSTSCRAPRSTGSAPRRVQTTRMAFHAIKAGEGDIFVSGGRRVRLAVHRAGPAPAAPTSDGQNPLFAEAAGPQRGRSPRPTRRGPTRARTACCPTSTSRWARPPRTSPRSRGISRERQDEWGVASARTAPRRPSPTGSSSARSRRSRCPTAPSSARTTARAPASRSRRVQGLQPGVPRAGHRHRRQLLPAQRRRRRAGRHERHQGRASSASRRWPGSSSTGVVRPVARDHGPRPGRGVAPGARPAPA